MGSRRSLRSEGSLPDAAAPEPTAEYPRHLQLIVPEYESTGYCLYDHSCECSFHRRRSHVAQHDARLIGHIAGQLVGVIVIDDVTAGTAGT